VSKLERLLLKHPRDAFVNASTIAAEWQELHYLEPPDFEKAQTEYDEFVRILESHVTEIHFLPSDAA
jgi:N-dimethylarginine dimethylaminohydrolase